MIKNSHVYICNKCRLDLNVSKPDNPSAKAVKYEKARPCFDDSCDGVMYRQLPTHYSIYGNVLLPTPEVFKDKEEAIEKAKRLSEKQTSRISVVYSITIWDSEVDE